MKLINEVPGQSRRDFIRLLSGGAAGLSLMFLMGGCEDLLDQIRNRPIRRFIRPGSAEADHDVAVYRAAVAAMKALPASDPRNWAKQAAIHANFCPHGNWFFLPWHRAYLFYFEQICRELTGEEKWALPYWNWSAQRSIPAPFWGTSANALFHSPRAATAASVTPADVFALNVLDDVLNEPNFLLFASGTATQLRPATTYGVFEGNQHNRLHGFVGGTMGLMTSPLDPIFWPHHNMVDYGWAEWNITRNHANTNDSVWTSFSLAGMFVDGHGNPADLTVGTTTLMPFLSYQFEQSPTSAVSLAGVKRIDLIKKSEQELKDLKKALEKGASVRLDFTKRLAISRGISLSMDKPVSLPVKLEQGLFENLLTSKSQTQGNRALLTVGKASLLGTDTSFVRVFVNKPDAGMETPTTDPHYAGTFAFFGDEQHRQHMTGANFIVDITAAVQRLRRAGELVDGSQLSVQLVAVPLQPESPKLFRLGIEFLELGVSPVSINKLTE